MMITALLYPLFASSSERLENVLFCKSITEFGLTAAIICMKVICVIVSLQGFGGVTVLPAAKSVKLNDRC